MNRAKPVSSVEQFHSNGSSGHEHIEIRDDKLCRVIDPRAQSGLRPNVDRDQLDRLRRHAREPDLAEESADVQLVHLRVPDPAVGAAERARE